MDEIERVPIPQKLMLTVKEASEYSNIGINTLDRMLRAPNCPFVLFIGTGKRLIKRKEFEEYISHALVI